MSSLVLTLTESNVSVTNNTSDVSVAVTVKFTDGWWAAADAGSSMTVTCNGTSKTLKFGAYNIGANGSKNLGSVKFTGIKHNSDGSKSVSARLQGQRVCLEDTYQDSKSIIHKLDHRKCAGVGGYRQYNTP